MTYRSSQEEVAHLMVVAAAAEEHQRRGCRARGGEEFRPPVEQGALVGERKGRGHGEA